MTADHAGQTGDERDVLNRVCRERYPHGATLDQRAEVASELSRPVPVPGQALGAPLGEVTVGQAARERGTAAPERDTTVPLAAREAAVEAVARWLQERSPDGDTPWELWADRHLDGWRIQARELLSLPEVAALSAAGGQGQLAAVLKLHQAEDVNHVGGGREPMCVECVKPSPCPTALAAGQGQS